MPEHLRALVVILILAAFTFFLAKKITATLISPEQFKRWRNAWIGITLIAFLAGNFWSVSYTHLYQENDGFNHRRSAIQPLA